MHSSADVRGACARLSGSRETFPFGAATLVFKVAGRMSALTDSTADSPTLLLKVRPEHGEALRAHSAAILAG